MKKNFLQTVALCGLMGLSLVACEDNNGSNGGDESSSSTEKYIIAASGAKAAGQRTAPTYILDQERIDTGTASILSEGGSTQVGTSESYSHWLFPDNKWAFALQYNQGSNATMRFGSLNAEGKFTLSSMQSSMPRFTAFGTSGKYVILAAVGEMDSYDATDVNKEHPKQGLTFSVINPEVPSSTSYTFITEDLFGDGEYYTISGFIPVGNKIYSAFIPCGYSDYGCTYNLNKIPSNYQDSIVTENGVKSLTTTLHPNKVVIGVYNDENSFGSAPSQWITIDEDNSKISLPHSRFRSQYYHTFCAGADNNLYVFSNNNYRSYYGMKKSDKPAGVIRINTTTNSVDESFYYNIESLSESVFGEPRSFFQVWHITSNKFLIRFYDDSSMNYEKIRCLAIFDANNGTLSAVTGFPTSDEISDIGRFIHIEDGKAFLPVTLLNGDPTVYIVDATTGTATAGMTVTADGGISAIGKLHN